MKNMDFHARQKKEILKAQLQERIQPPPPKTILPSSYLSSGVPLGAIIEIAGPGKTEFVVQLLSEYPETRVAWIESVFSIYPFGMLQRKISLSRVLFIEAQQHLEWAALQILKSQIFPFIVLYGQALEVQNLRRIQLASEKAQACVLWLTSQAQSYWPLSLVLQTQRE